MPVPNSPSGCAGRVRKHGSRQHITAAVPNPVWKQADQARVGENVHRSGEAGGSSNWDNGALKHTGHCESVRCLPPSASRSGPVAYPSFLAGGPLRHF